MLVYQHLASMQFDWNEGDLQPQSQANCRRIQPQPDTVTKTVAFDGDGHFSKADKIIINFGEEEPYGGYLLEFRDNKHPDLVYKIRIKESDFAKV